ncbi:uncharacterized protein (DUF58 family) [Catenulispora sp. GAS73]|uniref:DUF58 domain-containing protein n=1 Tax=Catenulispora sp. GAS73 TaxID=3156269 RepID=UPI0035159FF8
MLTRSGVGMAVAALVLLGLGAAGDYPELVALALAALACLAVAALWMLLRPDLAATREIRPERVTAGEPAFGVITLSNEARRRSPPILAEEAVAAIRVPVSIPSLAPGATSTCTYPLPTAARGVFQVGPLTIGHSDPLRLMQVGRAYNTYSTLFVHPRVRQVAPVPTGHTRDMDGPTSSFSQHGGIAFHSLREYVPGDDWRLVHWKSTARTGDLMVRHNVVPNQPRLIVVLDTSSRPYSEDSFEDAVSAAASLALAAIRDGFPLEVRTTGGQAMTVERGGEGATAALDLLAAAAVSADDPGLAALPGLVSFGESEALGVITGQPEAAALAVLPAIRRHVLMISLVQFLGRFGVPAPAPPGVVSLAAHSLDEFAQSWNTLVRI